MTEEQKGYFLRESKKGSQCSKEGKKYEFTIHSVVSKLKNEENNMPFNTQKVEELGGCSNRADIICNFKQKEDTPIEIKKELTPDWMQCILKFDFEETRWKPSDNSQKTTRTIFAELLNSMDNQLFNGKIPPFCLKQITHREWIKIKSDTNDFDDQYFDCPSNTIANLYLAKGCKYIQISEKGSLLIVAILFLIEGNF